MSTELIGAVPGETLGALADILLKRKNGSLTDDHIKRFAVKQNPFAVETIDSGIVFWTGLYAVVFGMDVKADLLKLNWPEPDFNHWDVPMVKGLRESFVQNALARWNKFPVGSYYGDLDAMVKENDRHPRDGTYGVRFRAFREADDDQKNISAERHKSKELNTKGNTLLERQVLEPMYFLKSGGDHLDKETVTHCIGSRFSDGRVPDADWHDGFYVSYGYHLDSANPSLRARVAVLRF
ncbi:MAG TPA: hypothetical protein VJH94_05135 [Candidatus Paceibacterota bacterium]